MNERQWEVLYLTRIAGKWRSVSARNENRKNANKAEIRFDDTSKALKVGHRKYTHFTQTSVNIPALDKWKYEEQPNTQLALL